MYAVVGCRDCGALWVVSGRPETTRCPRCGTRHRFEKLHRFAETADEDAARRARSTLLAERSEQGEVDEAAEAFTTLADRDDPAAITDEEYLEGSGIDVDEVEAAGERAASGRNAGGGNRIDRVRAVLRELDEPTASEVVDAAEERGVPPEATRELLTKLIQGGEVSESGGRYRLL